jgi:N utilization substance protein A
LEGLFKREVPEVAKGSVVIKNIAREAGVRSKVAVFSNQQGIDPVGSCVGQRGVRVQAIIQEFGGAERIDIIQWYENPKDYIAQALSPAKNVRVELDKKEEKTAYVYVPVEELSLAIGRDGQNVRLASKLTDYRIEIEEDKTAKKETEETKTEIKTEEVKTEPSSAKATEGQGKEKKKTEEKKEKAIASAKSDLASGEPKEVPVETKV